MRKRELAKLEEEEWCGLGLKITVAPGHGCAPSFLGTEESWAIDLHHPILCRARPAWNAGLVNEAAHGYITWSTRGPISSRIRAGNTYKDGDTLTSC